MHCPSEKSQWFGDVHASVAKCRCPECSYAEIEWTIHKSNPTTYLQNIVNPLTRYFICSHYIPRDCPWAGKRCSRLPSFHNNFKISKWWSLTILCGRLFLAHHLAIWALKFKFHKLLQKERVWLKYSPNFFSSMSTMWYFDGLLALVSKCCKYRSILTFRSFIFKCGLDQILTKASKCMTLEIECCSVILRVQVALNTFMTLSLAVLGSRLKKVKLSPFIIPNRNFCFEKPINGRMPADLKTFYNHMVRNKKYMESKIVCTKFLLISFSVILITRR